MSFRHSSIRLAALAAIFTTACLPGRAQAENADPFADPVIRSVQQRHDKGVEGDKQAVIDLVADLEKMLAKEPGNQLIRVYLGSAYTLRSRDAIFYQKMDYLNKAKEFMTEAVDAEPDNVAVRFVRAVNLINLPAIFNTRTMARDDFKRLLRTLEGAAPPRLNAETRQAIYYYAGLSYQQTGEPDQAAAAWRAGLAISPESKLGRKIARELKSHTPAPPKRRDS